MPDSDVSDEDEDEMATVELPKNKKKGVREAISAEVYGKYNQKKPYQPKIVAKSEEQKERIRKRLLQAFMFSSLEEKEREIVINAMEEKKFS